LAAISFARIRRLYFAASDAKSGGVDHGLRIFDSTSCHHKPEIIAGLGEQAAATLLREFFEARR
jgi:tRNA(adenine34) deaminase